MVALVNLIAIGLAIVCVILVIGSRDRMRTLEFRLALLERRLRESQAPTAPTATELPAEPDSSIVPEPAPAATVESAEPDAPAPQSPPQTEPVAPAAAEGPSLEERFGTQWVVWAGGIAVAIEIGRASCRERV